MKVNCANAGLIFFLADKVTPTCLFLHTDYHYPYDFMSGNVGTYIYILPCLVIIAFCQLLTLRSILWGFSPDNKKKKEKKRKERKNKDAESMDRSCKFEGVVSQKLDGTWLFMRLRNIHLGLKPTVSIVTIPTRK